MPTVRDILTDATIKGGIITPDETLPANEAAFLLRELNRLIESWNAQELMIYTLNRQTFSLIAGQQKYTISDVVGSDWLYPRPTNIQYASLLLNTNPALPVEIPMKIDTDSEWRLNAVKAVTSTFPLEIWFSGNYPTNEACVWPVPTDNTNKIILGIWGKTENFADLDTLVQFPNGYYDALVDAMAIRACVAYQKAPDPMLVRSAMNSKRIVENFNSEPIFGSSDYPSKTGTNYSLAARSRGRVVD